MYISKFAQSKLKTVSISSEITDIRRTLVWTNNFKFDEIISPEFLNYCLESNVRRESFEKKELLDFKPKSEDLSYGFWYLNRIKELQDIKFSVRSKKQWHEDFDPPNSTSIYWADYILDILRVLDVEFRKVTCSVNGGIALCFLKGRKYADIECFNDGSILAVTNQGDYDSIPDVWTVYQDDYSIKQTIGKIQGFFNH